MAILPVAIAGAYPGEMAHTPLMLSALATSAVPGFQAVSAQNLSTPERDAALVHDVNNQPFLIEVSQTDSDETLHRRELAAASALTEGLRSRLSFRVPQVRGTSEVGGRLLSVGDYLPGTHLTPKAITPVSAANIGIALATIHSLPTSGLADHDRLRRSALERLRECAAVVDSAAASGLLPQALLRRWETACEDQGLWQFDTTVIQGHMHLSRILFDDHAVSAIDGWSDFHQGDPAADLAWLTLPANSSFAAAVHTSYVASRPGADKWIMQRARFSAELDIAKWLLHGLDTAQDAIVRDATEMLNTLSDRVSTNMEHALTAPVTQIAENPQAS